MRKLYTALFIMLLALQGQSQCLTTVEVTGPLGAACIGTSSNFTPITSTFCANVNQIAYYWNLQQLLNNGSIVTVNGSEVSDNVTALSEIPSYTTNWTAPGLYRACLLLLVIDTNGDTISTGSACSQSISVGTPLISASSSYNNQCGQSNCVILSVSGGTPPYVYSSVGITLSSPVFCFTTGPGVYPVLIVDAAGCVTQTSVIIGEETAQNNTCDNARTLVAGEALHDTICYGGNLTAQCSDTPFYQAGWYSIQSGNDSILQLGISNNLPGTAGGGIYNNMAVELYEVLPDQGCDSALLVHCLYGNSCSALSQAMAINPNTNYLIRVLSPWTTALSIDILPILGTTPIDLICGCTNNLSCNYDPNALLNDGSCGWNGCTDQNACNYLSYATCNDGSCIYGNDLTGVIFHDVNNNGIRDLYPLTEPLIGGIGEIYIEELGTTIFPNNDGSFNIPELPVGPYTITFTDPNGYWTSYSTAPIYVTLPTCNGMNIPILPSSGVAAEVTATNGWLWGNFMCNNGISMGLIIENTGTQVLNGDYHIQFNGNLVISTLSNSIPITAINNGNDAYFQIIDLQPGESVVINLHIAGPGAQFVGTTYTFGSTLTLYDNNAVPFYNNSWSRVATVTCAYDPNDKAAIPEGYTADHFILSDTELTYRIRFQNTGNAPAFNVDIVDQIDTSAFDLSTFTPIAGSHSFTTEVDPNGRIRFFFQNIMLPDSLSNEPESQGFVTYSIKPKTNLTSGALLQNTASIFFDDNPAITTNTTSHKIFDCNWITPLQPNNELCEGSIFSYSDQSPYVESYLWTINGVAYLVQNPPLGPNEIVFAPDTGTYTIGCIRTNPLCTNEESIILTVHPSPVLGITESNGILNAGPGGVVYTWSFNENIIPNATEQTYTPLQSGTYEVSAYNEWFCSATSEPYLFQFISVNEPTAQGIMAYPNPVEDVLNLKMPEGKFNLRVYNSQGQILESVQNVRSTVSLDFSNYSSALYHLIFTGVDGEIIQIEIIKK